MPAKPYNKSRARPSVSAPNSGYLHCQAAHQAAAKRAASLETKGALTAAWASVAINALVVIVAVGVPYFQYFGTQVEQRSRTVSERKLLLSELRRMRNELHPYVYALAQIHGDQAVDLNKLAEADAKVRLALGRVNLIESRFAVEPDYFEVTSQARAALNDMQSSVEALQKSRVGDDAHHRTFSNASDSLKRGFLDLAVLTNLNPDQSESAMRRPLISGPCERDVRRCSGLIRQFELMHRHVYGPAEMKGEMIDGPDSIPEDQYVSHPPQPYIEAIP